MIFETRSQFIVVAFFRNSFKNKVKILQMSVTSSANNDNNMAVANLNLPHFPIFDTTEVDTLPQRWKTSKQRFEILCNAIGVHLVFL